MRASHQAGFTLLEAVVAMTLLAVVGGALLAWLNSGFRSLQRVEAAEERIEAAQVAMAYLETLNPMQDPNGEVRLGHYLLSWQSSPRSTPKPVVSRHGAQPGIYDAQLFRVETQVRARDELLFRFRLEKVGHVRVASRSGDG
ncbi:MULTISPECIES: type II secretion system protein J [Pseudomonas]|uniref:PulJ/GspJ family protein n=1 Tax=Pseudomonadaceae TaxID=135621 RepID=UPI00048F4648|nr:MULTISPECIES: prepilin-type N-terminal cleavage/methylation domain-containing protein [Pseudomonas]MDE3738024.1 prepilin-type N-terminal cleavage/methylation domain-containing protein [Pseudomonas resinovorans]